MSEKTDEEDKKLAKKLLAAEKRSELDDRAKAILFYFRTHEHYTLTTLERKCDGGALVALIMRKLLFRRMDLETEDTWVYQLTEKGIETVAKEAAQSHCEGSQITALAA